MLLPPAPPNAAAAFLITVAHRRAISSVGAKPGPADLRPSFHASLPLPPSALAYVPDEVAADDCSGGAAGCGVCAWLDSACPATDSPAAAAVSIAVGGAASASKSFAGATAEEHKVELLLPVTDAGGGLAAGAALAAACLSLSCSAAASRAFLRASCCPSDFRPRFGICRVQASWTRKCSQSDC